MSVLFGSCRSGTHDVLRRWLAGATLPWSPASCRRIWFAALARGDGEAAAIVRLEHAQRKTLSRDRLTQSRPANP
ncbi:DUF6525 family protein [Salipiger aestuarii]|uniref:DUF6525 family protein n=1 Tax=Salipiger aestuarii TaxID=568098 RepID=UPI000A018041|nr:DUF6525 family protein [Salipiger aestuarii]